MGIWLWDHYFGKSAGYAPGTEEIALLKIDRDLRLADSMTEDPPWLRWLAGVEEPATSQQNAIKVFRKLAADKSLGPQGMEAFAIIKAKKDGLPVGDTLAEMMHGQILSDFAETSGRLANHQGTWWHARLIEAWEKTMRPACQWRQAYGNDCRQLRARAVVLRSMVWLLGFVGLAFLPGTFVVLKRGLHAKPRGYGGAWSLPLGLVVFLVATLAWIGFTMVLELGFDSVQDIPPAVAILLDSAARLLPSLIAIGFLFRRPSHAARVMGLNKPFSPKTVLGLFSLLLLIDQVLRSSLGRDSSTDPGGGLSAGEAGMWGLVFAVLSACMLAPLAEELLYRGVLFRSFWNRLGVIPAALLSSAVFATLHFYDGYGLASVGIFGISCTLLYAATGSLGATIALHMLYNSAIKIPEWLVYHGPLG